MFASALKLVNYGSRRFVVLVLRNPVRLSTICQFETAAAAVAEEEEEEEEEEGGGGGRRRRRIIFLTKWKEIIIRRHVLSIVVYSHIYYLYCFDI